MACCGRKRERVLVAPWVVAEEKQPLFCSLVGFLKDGWEGIFNAVNWLEIVWGKKPVSMRRLNELTVLIQVSSEEEVSQVLVATSE